METEDLTLVWKALSDPTRRRLLDLLRGRPRTTGELADRFEVSRFAVMKHLDLLERAGLIVVRRQGRERWNHLNAVPLQRIYERWMSPYAAHWASSLLQLTRHVEAPAETAEEETMNEITTTPATSVRSMHIEQEVAIAAPPARVFDALTSDLAAWWGAPYLISEAASDIVLEPTLGGRMYEMWGADDGALWGTVTGIRRSELLELTGSIAMSSAVHGKIKYELEATEQGTRLRFSHRAIGDFDEGSTQDYSSGWNDLLATRLKAFVEDGKRLGLRP